MSEQPQGPQPPEEPGAGDAAAPPGSDDPVLAHPASGATAELPASTSDVTPQLDVTPQSDVTPQADWTPQSDVTPQSDWMPPAVDTPGLASLFPADRPERAVGAAFAAGLLLALILKRLAR